MQVRFLLGRAGSGKTYRCLSEAREALVESPQGLPIVLLAPKQGTYQLEQQLLSTPSLAGYTRLSILSFEALARLVLERLGEPCPAALTDEGRLMVLRGLLTRHRDKLKLFRASARLSGFAQQLSQVLGELQRAGLGPLALTQIAEKLPENEGLRSKLQDLAWLLQEYLAWLKTHALQDQEALLKVACDSLRNKRGGAFRFGAIWVDGFAEFSPLELDLLSEVLKCCQKATLTFCIDRAPKRKNSWLSHWTMIERNLENCRKRFADLPEIDLQIETLDRGKGTRFSKNSVLNHLEENWDEPRPFKGPDVPAGIRLVHCTDRENEVVVAAREILDFVRNGGRYREASVLLRNLEPYHRELQRVFSRYEIPYFLDRRESVSHHPLAELTRSALRVVAFGWQPEDWFAALKSGLVPIQDDEADLFENEALARGWKGQRWREPLQLKDTPKTPGDAERLKRLQTQLEEIRLKTVPCFERLATALAATRNRPTGPELAKALRDLWASLRVRERLEYWSTTELSESNMQVQATVHETVWDQMSSWLDNAALAFPVEALSLRDWLPILEAGLANLSVGIIPPSLDQVLVGAVDRSRTPEVKLAMVLGLNEGVFPARPEPGKLLSDPERLELERHQVELGPNARAQLGRERYFAYIACTRARQRLVLTWASQDGDGGPLNPSSLLSHLEELFPGLKAETATPSQNWREAQHPNELGELLLRARKASASIVEDSAREEKLIKIPKLAALVETLGQLKTPISNDLSPDLAERLYGPVLRTSVSRMEQFAACPFRFFVHSGLRTEERKAFELDVREQGTFQHDVLALFHEDLRKEGKRWRDITPAQARERIARIATGLMTQFRDGLLQTSAQAKFTARVLTQSLQDFVEVLTEWMRGQYLFDPTDVELPFGTEGAPAWALALEKGKRIEMYGRIDRIDLFHETTKGRALCVVVDYKSGQKKLETLLIEHGLQLQLLTYLSVLQHWPNARADFGVDQLEPAGVFYVNLRGQYEREKNRTDALSNPQASRKLAYRHVGRFDVSALRKLDSCSKDKGDQFNFRLKKDGEIMKNCREALPAEAFRALLDKSENILREMGERIYSGSAEVGPYRKGLVKACDDCNYQAICRIDPWTHRFRVLRANGEQGDTEPVEESDEEQS